MPRWLSRPRVMKDCIRELKPGYLKQIVNKSGVNWEGKNTLKCREQRSLLLGSGRGRGHRVSYKARYLCWEDLRAGMEWEEASSESRT